MLTALSDLDSRCSHFANQEIEARGGGGVSQLPSQEKVEPGLSLQSALLVINATAPPVRGERQAVNRGFCKYLFNYHGDE